MEVELNHVFVHSIIRKQAVHTFLDEFTNTIVKIREWFHFDFMYMDRKLVKKTTEITYYV
jgi:hypothetical protein